MNRKSFVILIFSIFCVFSSFADNNRQYWQMDDNYPIVVKHNKIVYNRDYITTDTVLTRNDFIKLKQLYNDNFLHKQIKVIKELPNRYYVFAEIREDIYNKQYVDVTINNPVEHALYYRKKSIAYYCAGIGCFATGSILIGVTPLIKNENGRLALYCVGGAMDVAGSACMITGIVFSVKKEKYLIIGCSNYGISAQWKF